MRHKIYNQFSKVDSVNNNMLLHILSIFFFQFSLIYFEVLNLTYISKFPNVELKRACDRPF